MLRRQSAERYVRELKAFRHRHRHLRGIYLIHDNDPTHTAAKTRDYLAGCSGWWRSRFTPVRASWLDQAELLLGAFGYHYLKRGSWHSLGPNSLITWDKPGRSTIACMPIRSSGHGRVKR